MRVFWTKKAEKNLDKIFQHIIKNFLSELAERTYFEVRLAVAKLSELPQLGRRIGGYEERRQLVVSGNAIIYEIVLGASSYIVIRNVRPRGTHRL
jgi:plasmid stabilization system protein ParE